MRFADTRSNHLNTGIGMTNIFYDKNDTFPWATLVLGGQTATATGWDKGRVPASSRMNAEEVARFPFYDPVIFTNLGTKMQQLLHSHHVRVFTPDRSHDRGDHFYTGAINGRRCGTRRFAILTADGTGLRGNHL